MIPAKSLERISGEPLIAVSTSPCSICALAAGLLGARAESQAKEAAAARAPQSATPPPRRRAPLRIFVVRCSLPCDPPVGGHSCNGGIIPGSHRVVCDHFTLGSAAGCPQVKF